MINVTDIILTIEQIAGSNTVLVTDVRPFYKYEGDKRTDIVDGYRHTVVAPDKKYAEFTIKAGKPVVTPEQLAAAKGGMVKAKVKGFQGRFYRTRTGDYAFTSTAEALEVMPE